MNPLNLHLISYDKNLTENIKQRSEGKYHLNIYDADKYLEHCHANRNNLHIEAWRNMKGTNGVILEDYSGFNHGIMIYADLILKYLNNFQPDWEIVFLNCASVDFWRNQKSLNFPGFTNKWGGFGDYVSTFFVKKIMEDVHYKRYDIKNPLSLTFYIINPKKIDAIINKIQGFNLINNTLESIIYRNMHMFKLYVNNPRLNLKESYFYAKEECDALFKFAWPPLENNIFKIPYILKDYHFELEIGEDLIGEMSLAELEKKMVFKLNSGIISKPKLFDYLHEDPFENLKIRKVRFQLPKEIQLKIRNVDGYVLENQKLQVSINIDEKKYTATTFFNVKGKNPLTTKTK